MRHAYWDTKPLPAPSKSITVKIDGWVVQTTEIRLGRDFALRMAGYFFDALTGKTWGEKPNERIQFSGGQLTYREYIEWQREYIGAPVLEGKSVWIEDENGNILDQGVILSCLTP